MVYSLFGDVKHNICDICIFSKVKHNICGIFSKAKHIIRMAYIVRSNTVYVER